MYSLASWVLAVAAGLALEGPATNITEAVTGLPAPVAATVGFVVTVVAVEGLFSVAGYLAVGPIVAAVRRGRLSAVDRVLGAAPAAIRSLFIVAVANLANDALPVSSDPKAAVEKNRTGRVANPGLTAVEPQIQSFIRQPVRFAVLRQP